MKVDLEKERVLRTKRPRRCRRVLFQDSLSFRVKFEEAQELLSGQSISDAMILQPKSPGWILLGSEDHLRRFGCEFLTRFGRACLNNDWITLRRTSYVQRSAYREMLPLVIENVQFVRID